MLRLVLIPDKFVYVFVSQRTIGENAWSPTLLEYTQFLEEDIKPVARAVLAAKSDSPTELKAVNRKYTMKQYGIVATVTIFAYLILR